MHIATNTPSANTLARRATRLRSARWRYERSQTLDGEPAWCASLVAPNGEEIATCFVTRDETDVDSDGCGPTKGYARDEIDWPAWGDAPDY